MDGQRHPRPLEYSESELATARAEPVLRSVLADGLTVAESCVAQPATAATDGLT